MRIYTLIIALILARVSTAQHNIVPNYSFESISSCPSGGGQVFHAISWYSPGIENADLLHDCNSSIPFNALGYQYAKTGISYAGLYAYSDQIALDSIYREYITVKLTDSLLPNYRYCIEFYLNLADSANFAAKIGAFLSADSIYSNRLHPLPYQPQVMTGTPVTSKTDWIKVYGEFFSLGGEKYLTIGNFWDNQNADTIFTGGGDSSFVYFNASYYYIDDISVKFCDTLSSVKNNPYPGNEPSVFPNPFSNSFTISSGNLSTGSQQIMLLNIYGEIIRRYRIDGLPLRVGTADLSPGCYLLKTESGLVKKLVKY